VNRVPLSRHSPPRHCEERSDEAIQPWAWSWIASLTLAMTARRALLPVPRAGRGHRRPSAAVSKENAMRSIAMVRGRRRLAQNRGGAPSPGLLRFACNPTSPRTRGEVKKRKPFSRRIVCARGLFTTPPQSEKPRSFRLSRKREAEPQKAHCPTNVRVKRGCALLNGGAPPFGAHACGTRHRLLPRWLSFRTGFPAPSADGCFARFAKLPRLSTLRADRSLCRSTGDPKPPGCGAASSARGHRGSLSSLRHAFRKGALGERDSLSVSELETNVNEKATAPTAAISGCQATSGFDPWTT
jgi:hypothetical protein